MKKTINNKPTIAEMCDYLGIDGEDREWILKPLVDMDSHMMDDIDNERSV